MELLFLGTGAGIPANMRNVSSVALQLLEIRKSVWLFDCGEGTQHQIMKTKLKPGKIEKIFISHLHGDHIFGLPGLIGSRSFQGAKFDLTIYGPKGLKDFLHTTLRISSTHLKYKLNVIEITEGIIFEDGQFSVEAIKLDHVIDSFGFRVVEKDRPGTLKVEKLQELNVPKGPVYRQLKNGETVTLDDGRVLDGKLFTSEPVKGKIIAIAGDTKKCEGSLKLAKNADWLVIEATFQKGQEEMARDYFHSTNVESAETARDANVKNMVMTHISSRFSEEDVVEFLQQARNIFENTQIANDFLLIKI
ncbi:MAG: ribonuclease [Bacillales bacterium]|jgi:ribonuclease Z|nr:ribonuclease [Bacillales bacterium]